MAIDVGDKAPDFTLPGDGDSDISLADYAGQNVVLYFYPKDMTPGCTTESIDFTTLMPQFTKANTVIIGISKDTVARHDKFRDKHNLTVRLASDEDGKVLDAYGVWSEKKLYGRTFLGIVRSTFLIDGEGAVRSVWRKVRVKGHADVVLGAVLEASEAL